MKTCAIWNINWRTMKCLSRYIQYNIVLYLYNKRLEGPEIYISSISEERPGVHVVACFSSSCRRVLAAPWPSLRSKLCPCRRVLSLLSLSSVCRRCPPAVPGCGPRLSEGGLIQLRLTLQLKLQLRQVPRVHPRQQRQLSQRQPRQQSTRI